MAITVEWLGVSTFRLTTGDLVVFLDAYLDRVPAAPPVGVGTADVDRADWILVGHSHFDHLWGAETIARQTGATVAGSHESIRLLAEAGIPEEQLVAVAGGEPLELGPGITAQVLPMLHSCVWAASAAEPGEACLGDLGVSHQRRSRRLAGAPEAMRSLGPEVSAHVDEIGPWPRGDGGALAYLITTPEGSLLWKDTSGHWSGLLGRLRPDVALLAAVGRGNVDGEPVQGSLADFVASEVDLLRPRRVIPCHHDDWMPPLTRPVDLAPVAAEVRRRRPDLDWVELAYATPYPLFTGLPGAP